jgi:hypothetical protein
MERGRQIALFVLLVIAAGLLAAYFLFSQEPGPVPAPAVAPLASPTTIPPERLVVDARLAATIPAGTENLSAQPTPLPHSPQNTLDAKTRAALLATLLSRIEAAPGARSPDSAGAADPASPPAAGPGTLSKEYIQEQIREIVPLVKQCYEQALAERPDTAGKLVVRFSIVADPELGGLIEQSEILESEEGAANENLSECVRETMYALRLKAPEGGGRVVVTYPFIFRKGTDR